jgi:hypothetical protein
MRVSLQMVVFLILCGCSKAQDVVKPNAAPNVSVSLESGAGGYIYLDGKFTGKIAPNKVVVGKGMHIISVADPSGAAYYRKEAVVTKDTAIKMTNADIPAPRTWKALWIGVHEAVNPNGGSTHFSTEDLNAAYDFFKWSIAEHFEKYSFGVTHWDVERLDINDPVSLTQSGSNQIIPFQNITNKISAIVPGAYDCVFVFFRQQEGAVAHIGNYFGLGWCDPLREVEKTGYVIVKFDVGNSIQDKISYYKSTDPGIFLHEWLHTVGESYFSSLGYNLPMPAGDGLRVHAAEIYGYTFPWLGWYKDFMAGKVVSKDGVGYCGIGPEALLNNSVRKTALGGN